MSFKWWFSWYSFSVWNARHWIFWNLFHQSYTFSTSLEIFSKEMVLFISISCESECCFCFFLRSGPFWLILLRFFQNLIIPQNCPSLDSTFLGLTLKVFAFLFLEGFFVWKESFGLCFGLKKTSAEVLSLHSNKPNICIVAKSLFPRPQAPHPTGGGGGIDDVLF